MVDPRDLVAAARSLSGGTPNDAALRRAVSTAYYALFHAMAGFAAGRLVGPSETSAAFTLVYRGLDHKRMRDVLEGLSKPTLPRAAREALRRSTMSEELRDFANVFVPMQQLRHLADYHPAIRLTASEASGLIDEAEKALDVFQTIDRCEMTDVIVYMTIGARAS